ncbi:MAG: hypothetical protein U0O22_01335 [Acutalibacteraceae bacterium]
MATCEQCIHYEVCQALEKNNQVEKINPKSCSLFKDKSKFLELPCKVGVVGNIVYFIKNGKVNKCYVTTIRIHNEKSVIFTLMIEELYAFYDVSAKDIYKTVFLTKEEAEKALKERGDKYEQIKRKNI